MCCKQYNNCEILNDFIINILDDTPLIMTQYIIMYIELIEKFGSVKILKSTFKQFIWKGMGAFFHTMMNLSKRIVYTQKHIDILHKSECVIINGESVLFNKLQIQERNL